ncbi:unnamed protein product [Closterium sp. Yama58-4]|nr:unnamed protein product [Closterium sp. Yama58-4]
MPDEFLASNPPPLWITLYHVVTRLPDSLRPVRDQFLSRSPTELTVDLLEKELLAAEASIVAADDAGAGVAGVGVVAEEAGVEVVAVEVRLERLVAAVVEVTAALGVVTGAEVAAEAEVVVAAAGVEVAGAEAEGVVVVEARGATCGGPHQTERCFARLNDAWRTQFPGGGELPRWAELLRKGVDIWALDFDAILTAMYAMSISGEGAQYLRVPPDPSIQASPAAALGASVSASTGTTAAAALGACAL